MTITVGGREFSNISRVKAGLENDLKDASDVTSEWIVLAITDAWGETGLADAWQLSDIKVLNAHAMSVSGIRVSGRTILELCGVTSRDPHVQAADTAHAVEIIERRATDCETAQRTAGQTKKSAEMSAGQARDLVGAERLARIAHDFTQVGMAQISLLTALRKCGAPEEVYCLAQTAARCAADVEDELFGVLKG